MRTRKAKGKPKAPVVTEPGSQEIYTDGAVLTPFPSALQSALEEIFGFKLTVRTLTYIQKRLGEFGYAEQLHVQLQKIFTENRLQEFRTIFREVLNLGSLSG